MGSARRHIRHYQRDHVNRCRCRAIAARRTGNQHTREKYVQIKCSLSPNQRSCSWSQHLGSHLPQNSLLPLHVPLSGTSIFESSVTPFRYAKSETFPDSIIYRVNNTGRSPSVTGLHATDSQRASFKVLAAIKSNYTFLIII